MAFGIIFMFVNLLSSLRKKETAVSDPWGGTTLEWSVPSPPPVHNFAEPPRVKTFPYDFTEVKKRFKLKRS